MRSVSIDLTDSKINSIEIQERSLFMLLVQAELLCR
jgi:hypothetical protein